MAASPPVTETRHEHLRPTAAPWTALAWSAVALALGLAWLSGVVSAGEPGQSGFGSLFALLAPDASGPLNARTVAGAVSLLLGAVGAVCAVLMLRPRGGGGRAVEALSWTLGALVLLVFVDGQLLSWLGYTMILPVAGWIVPDLFQLWAEATFTASHLSTLFFAVGVAVWVAAALTRRRAVRGACQRCGRAPEWNAGRERAVRARALRVGRIAVAVACVVALFYPSLRLPWLFGIAVGVSQEQFDAMASDGTIVIGVGLGTAGLVGVVLMLGLVQRWGVRFPWWMAGLAGRRVPVGLAVVPASLVAVALVAMGRGTVVELLDAQARSLLSTEPLHAAAFASMAVWGAALGVATAAYAVRRRAECSGCGRGLPEALPGDVRGAHGVR